MLVQSIHSRLTLPIQMIFTVRAGEADSLITRITFRQSLRLWRWFGGVMGSGWNLFALSWPQTRIPFSLHHHLTTYQESCLGTRAGRRVVSGLCFLFWNHFLNLLVTEDLWDPLVPKKTSPTSYPIFSSVDTMLHVIHVIYGENMSLFA